MKKIISFLRKHYLLLGILLIAALLRLIGTNPGYNQFHSDEGITYSAATSMIKNGNLDPLRYDYPALVPEINYLFFRGIFIPITWTRYFIQNLNQIMDGTVHLPIAPLEAKRIFQVFILGERERNALFWGRYVTAIFSIGDVFLTYLLTKKMFSKKVALIAALLLTFNFKHVINSHIGLPDIYNAFFILLTLIFSFNLYKKPTLRNYLLTGIAAGLSFSIKYQFFTFFPFFLSHFYISFENRKINIKKLLNPSFFAALFCIPLVFLILNPYFFLYFDDAVKIVTGVSEKYGMGTKAINLYPLSYLFHTDYGPLEFLLMAIGVLLMLKNDFKKGSFLLAFLAPFAFMFLYYSRGGFYVRNFINVTPLMVIFAAYLLVFISNKIDHLTIKPVSIAILIVILASTIYVPAVNAITNSYSYTQPWSYDVLRDWETKNLPGDLKVAAHPFDPMAAPGKIKRTEFELAGSYSLAEHQEDGAEYALVNLNWASNAFYFWMNFGPSDAKYYWNKPTAMMRNTFHGVATEEMFRYQIFSVTKPWQAPDANLIFLKLPVWPKVDFINIKSFNFNSGLEGWVNRGTDNTSDFVLDNGSIRFEAKGNKFPDLRISSDKIPVKPGYLYKVTGLIKTEKLLEGRQRDGFIRLDYYSDNPDLDSVGISSSVSARVYGSTDWVRKEVVDRAPDKAKYLVVSFSVYDRSKTKIWLKDVNIYESKDKVEDITNKPPYLKKDIDLNLLYVESHGNL